MKDKLLQFYRQRNIYPKIEFGVFGKFKQYVCEVSYIKYGDNQIEYLSQEDVDLICKLNDN